MVEGVGRPATRDGLRFRLACPDGHEQFALLVGRDRRLAEERGEVRTRCWACRTDRPHEVVAP